MNLSDVLKFNRLACSATAPVKVAMAKPAFVSEHRHLVKVLRKGTPEEREEEAEDQASELEDMKAGGPGSGRHPGGGQSRVAIAHNGYHTQVSTVVNGAKSNYYDAADKACTASKIAESTNKKSDHQAAVDAHTKAADIILRQGGLVGRSNASRVANMHSNAAKVHSTPAVWPHGVHLS